jgi:hypothetical protein
LALIARGTALLRHSMVRQFSSKTLEYDRQGSCEITAPVIHVRIAAGAGSAFAVLMASTCT